MSTLNTLDELSVSAPVRSVPTAPALPPPLMVAPLTLTAPLIVPEPPKVPLPLTVTLPVPVPEPVLLFTNNVPALIVEPPEYVLAAFKVVAPLPACVSEPVP